MKKINIFVAVLSVFVLLIYAAFLFVVPNVVNLNGYKADIEKIVKESVNLDLNFETIALKTTPGLAVKLAINNVSLKYPNGNEILNLDRADATIPLLPLLVKNIVVSAVNINSPVINLSVDSKGHYDLEKYIIENLPKEDKQADSEQPLMFNFSKNMPKISVNDYTVNIFDYENKSKSVVKGVVFKIDDFTLDKHIKVVADGKLYVNDEEFITYDVKLSSFLPSFENNSDKEDEQTNVEFFNPFREIFQHKFKARILSDIKISQNKDKTLLSGFLNVDKLTFKSSGTMLPESFLYLKFNNEDIAINSEIYSAKDEKTLLEGNFNFGKKANLDLSVKNDSVKITNLKSIAVVLLDVLNIDNDIANLNTEGYLTANFNIKTDMKKLISNGKLQIKNAKISHKSLPVSIDNIKALFNFSNNKIIISDTSAFVNGSKLEVTGSIDDKTVADIKISTNKLPLTKVYQAFASPQMKNTYQVNGGELTLNAFVRGHLDKIAPYADISLQNLVIKDKSLNAQYSLASLSSKITSNGDKFNGDIAIKNVLVSIPEFNLHISAPESKIKLDEKDILINPTAINLDNSKLTLDGKVLNYMTNMVFDGVLKGNLNTNSLKLYLPKEIKNMTKNSGNLPMILLVSSNGKNTQISAQVLANAQNYFSPIEVEEMKYHTTILNFDSQLSGDIFTIKDLALYSFNNNAVLSNNLKTNISNSSQVAYINGKITNISGKAPLFQEVKFATSKNLSVNIPTMKNSSATINANVSADGNVFSPVLKGHLMVKNANIPDYALKIKDLGINFDKNTITGSSPELNINGSLISVNFNAKNDFTKDFIINNLTLNSSYLDLDKVLSVTANLPQSDYAPSASVPVKILKGNGTISKFLMGNIEASNVNANFSLNNNILSLSNIKANAYQGNVSGNISYNIPYLTLKASLSGSGLDANKSITAFMGLKDQIMGTLGFKADVSMSGSEYTQQMRTLKGTANFNVQNGQMGNLGKLEYYLNAQNLIASKLFNINLNSIIRTLSPKNTGKFSYLKGDLSFKNGYVYISPIVSSGPNMSLYMNGTFNLLNNIINLELLGRLSQDVHKSLGVVGDLSLSKLVSIGNSKFGNSVATIMTKYNAQTSTALLNKIPALTPAASDTKEFAVQLNGNIESASAVKSFKWLTTQDVAASAGSVQIKVPSAVQSVSNQLQQVTSKIKSQTGSVGGAYTNSGISNSHSSTTPKGTATSTNRNVEMPDFLKTLPDSFKSNDK